MKRLRLFLATLAIAALAAFAGTFSDGDAYAQLVDAPAEGCNEGVITEQVIYWYSTEHRVYQCRSGRWVHIFTYWT